jgi:hypothetical protein
MGLLQGTGGPHPWRYPSQGRSQVDGLDVAEVHRLRSLEGKIRGFKRLVAGLALDSRILQEVPANTSHGPRGAVWPCDTPSGNGSSGRLACRRRGLPRTKAHAMHILLYAYPNTKHAKGARGTRAYRVKHHSHEMNSLPHGFLAARAAFSLTSSAFTYTVTSRWGDSSTGPMKAEGGRLAA